MSGRWRRIDTDGAEAFVRETLLAPSRGLPVVAVSTAAGTGRPWIDPEALAADLEGRAEVVLIETGGPSWAISAALPKRLDVYGGAVRIWWPGLAMNSDPYDHPLVLIHASAEAERARRRVIAAVAQDDQGAAGWGEGRPAPAVPSRAWPETPPPPGKAMGDPVESAGPASTAQEVDPWQRIAEEYGVGDVVRGRVFRIEPGYVLVELLPAAGVVVPLAEIDYTWVGHPSDILAVGEAVNVLLLELDPRVRRGRASIKQALTLKPRAGISMRPGEPAYLEGGVEARGASVQQALRREEGRARAIKEELEAALEDRKSLAQHNERLRQQLVSVRRDLRTAEDRCRALEQRIAGEIDPLISETAFLAAVRVEHARRLDETDRIRYPLMKMRAGRAFLQSLRDLAGIEPEKVVEVCAQVASGRAHEIPGRSVHELVSSGGRAVVRPADRAKAWRCSLQEGTPSARRLHWWIIGGADGATIEFASVAVHDDFSIPI